jgi:hypothetical protein
VSAYGPLCTQFYDADKPYADAAEVAWYTARLPPDDPVLEVMSGSGRLLIPLLDRDVEVQGCDASAAMLASCEARLDRAGYRTSLFLQDATTLDLPFRYAAAFIAAGSFQLLADPGGARAALERIRAHLIAPSVLLLDLFIPAEAAHPPGDPVVETRTATLPDRTRITHRSTSVVDVARRRIDTTTRYEKRSGPMILAREDETLALTWYSEEAIAALLASAGFGDIAIEPSPGPISAEAPQGERRFAVRARG